MSRTGLVLLLATLAVGCRCKEPAPTTRAPTTTTWAPHTVHDVPDDVYGVPSWSRVFALAFERSVSIGVPACHVADAGCLGADPVQFRTEPMVSKALVVGRDEPLAFIGEQVTFLQQADRAAALEVAIDEALRVDPSTAPVAAVLFQNDVWERVDAITAAIQSEPSANWAVLERLRKRLIELLHHLSLTRAQLAALSSNEVTVANRFPELLAGFGQRDGWAEVIAESTERRGSNDWARTTRHSERHGFRVVFRVFIQHPAGQAGVEEAVRRWPTPLPAGTRFVITGTPLVVLKDGTLEAAPFITLLETRQAMRDDFPATQLGALENDVLEGRRFSLTHAMAQTGGLERLGRDTLIPVGATCMPDFTTRLPAASTCTTCHGATGARLTGPMAHGDIRFSVNSDETNAARAVAAAKRKSQSFRTLDW